MDHLLFMSYVFHAFASVHCALWSPVGKGLTSWLLFVTLGCVFVTFSCCILALVWYLIISIPDLCHHSYFVLTMKQSCLIKKNSK